MVTPNKIRRALAKLESATRDAAKRQGVAVLGRHNPRLYALALLQGDDALIYDLARALNFEMGEGAADFRNMPADAKPRALGAGASSTACDDQHTTAKGL